MPHRYDYNDWPSGEAINPATYNEAINPATHHSHRHQRPVNNCYFYQQQPQQYNPYEIDPNLIPYTQHRDDLGHVIEDAAFWAIVFYILGWVIKRMFHRPIASLVFMAACAGVVLTADHSLTVPCWICLIIALIGLGRVVR